MKSPRTVTRRAFLGAAAAGATDLSGAARRPNIVFILLDDLGSGDLGCYGQKHIQTPNIDRLAAHGMRFTDAYAGATVCAPSRSVLMTGLHTGHTSVRANAGTEPLLDEDVTVAEILKRAGYATGIFGKWGLGDAGSAGVPTQQGFDEAFGYLHQVHAHSYYPEFLWHNETKHALAGNSGGQRGQYSADIIAERALEFVRQNKSNPFFLYFTPTLPHARFEIPSVAPYQSKSWSQGEKTYAAMVTLADSQVGALLNLLSELGLERDTVVFLSSDNGAPEGEDKGYRLFASNGRLRGQKGQLYEGGIRAPLIVRWPGRIRAGSTSSVPCAFWDFLPTAAGIAGAAPPAGIDGISILPELTGGKQRRHQFLYWEFCGWDGKAKRLREEQLAQAVRMEEWKAVRPRPGKPLELYNLRADPSEAADVAARHPEVVARIEAYLKGARTPARPHDRGSMQWVG